jgi:hypothetical protein
MATSTSSRTLLAFLISAFAASIAVASAVRNITSHGDPNQACGPAKISDDIVIFLLGNYAAHAFTMPANPGETARSVAVNAFLALLFLTTGVYREISAIRRRAIFDKTDLHKAARTGTLCMVVRNSASASTGGALRRCSRYWEYSY